MTHCAGCGRTGGMLVKEKKREVWRHLGPCKQWGLIDKPAIELAQKFGFQVKEEPIQ